MGQDLLATSGHQEVDEATGVQEEERPRRGFRHGVGASAGCRAEERRAKIDLLVRASPGGKLRQALHLLAGPQAIRAQEPRELTLAQLLSLPGLDGQGRVAGWQRIVIGMDGGTHERLSLQPAEPLVSQAIPSTRGYESQLFEPAGHR